MHGPLSQCQVINLLIKSKNKQLIKNIEIITVLLFA